MAGTFVKMRRIWSRLLSACRESSPRATREASAGDIPERTRLRAASAVVLLTGSAFMVLQPNRYTSFNCANTPGHDSLHEARSSSTTGSDSRIASRSE
jgi:hypothetical protein